MTGAQVAVHSSSANLSKKQADTKRMRNDLLPADTIKGLLRSASTIYSDDAVIAVSFQLSESITFSTRTQPAQVEVVLTPSIKGTAPVKLKVQCDSARSSVPGVCHADIPVQADWFDYQLTADTVISIGYGLVQSEEGFEPSYGDDLNLKEETVSGSGSGNGNESEVVLSFIAGDDTDAYADSHADDLYTLGDVVATRSLPPIDVVDSIFAVLPSYPLYAGEYFDVDVLSRFKSYIKTVSFQLRVTGGLSIEYSSSYPKAAHDSSGAVFSQTKFDGDAQKVYAVLVGRRDRSVSPRYQSIYLVGRYTLD